MRAVEARCWTASTWTPVVRLAGCTRDNASTRQCASPGGANMFAAAFTGHILSWTYPLIFSLSQLQIQRLEKMHLVLWEAGGRDVPIFSKSREASWDMPHSGAKPKKFKIIGFVFSCVQFCIILFNCVQLFSALSQGTQWVGDNPRDSEDSPPITNSKTFVTRDLAVKMATRGRRPTSNENIECIGIWMDNSSF